MIAKTEPMRLVTVRNIIAELSEVIDAISRTPQINGTGIHTELGRIVGLADEDTVFEGTANLLYKRVLWIYDSVSDQSNQAGALIQLKELLIENSNSHNPQSVAPQDRYR